MIGSWVVRAPPAWASLLILLACHAGPGRRAPAPLPRQPAASIRKPGGPPPVPHAPSQAVEVVDRHGHTLFHLPLLSDEAPDACAPDVRDFVARFGHADRGHRVATRLDGGLQALAQVVVQRAVERLARPLRALDGPHGPLRA